MRKLSLAACCLLGFASLAADPAKPADGIKALERFMRPASYTGTIPKGAMGNPEPIATKGAITCTPLFDAMGYECELSDTLGTGKQAMNWKARLLIGWESVAKVYKAVMIQNMGTVLAMDGRIEGDKLVWETPNPVKEDDVTFKNRLTFDLGQGKFSDEHQLAGSTEWKIFEIATVAKK